MGGLRGENMPGCGSRSDERERETWPPPVVVGPWVRLYFGGGGLFKERIGTRDLRITRSLGSSLLGIRVPTLLIGETRSCYMVSVGRATRTIGLEYEDLSENLGLAPVYCCRP